MKNCGGFYHCQPQIFVSLESNAAVPKKCLRSTRPLGWSGCQAARYRKLLDSVRRALGRAKHAALG